MRDYQKATIKAHEFLIENNVSSFPINLFKIIEKNCWYVDTFSNMAKKAGTTYANYKRIYGKNCLGLVVYNGANYSIMYDDKATIGNQIFTIAHEIGHIVLGHLENGKGIMKITNSTLEESDYPEYCDTENEVSCFARNMVAPIIIIDQILMNMDSTRLISTFGISQSAAKTRIDFMNTDRKHSASVNGYNLILNCCEFLEENFGEHLLGNTCKEAINYKNKQFEFEQEKVSYC